MCIFVDLILLFLLNGLKHFFTPSLIPILLRVCRYDVCNLRICGLLGINGVIQMRKRKVVEPVFQTHVFQAREPRLVTVSLLVIQPLWM